MRRYRDPQAGHIRNHTGEHYEILTNLYNNMHFTQNMHEVLRNAPAMCTLILCIPAACSSVHALLRPVCELEELRGVMLHATRLAHVFGSLVQPCCVNAARMFDAPCPDRMVSQLISQDAQCNILIYCNHGRHRSVAFARILASVLVSCRSWHISRQAQYVYDMPRSRATHMHVHMCACTFAGARAHIYSLCACCCPMTNYVSSGIIHAASPGYGVSAAVLNACDTRLCTLCSTMNHAEHAGA